MQASHVADLFGGRKVLGRKISSLNDFVPMLRDGLPFASLESLIARFGIPRGDIARRKARPFGPISSHPAGAKRPLEPGPSVFQLGADIPLRTICVRSKTVESKGSLNL